jgi:hypothetical protein
MSTAMARKTVTQIYRSFEDAYTAMQSMPPSNGQPQDAAERAFKRSVQKVSALAWRIVKAPANSIDEMLLKIRVAGWSMGAERGATLAALDNWQPEQRAIIGNTAEAFALASIREDLRALTAMRAC